MTMGIHVEQVSHLEFIHSCNYIHCDIKPSNLLIGQEKMQNTVYLINFGVAQAYQCHQPFKEQVHFIGIPCFASIHALLGNQQSHQDDLESLAYMLIYLVCGSLPWQETTTISQIIDLKVCIGDSPLISVIPPEFLMVLEHARSPAFDKHPDYAYLRGLFEKLKASDDELDCI